MAIRTVQNRHAPLFDMGPSRRTIWLGRLLASVLVTLCPLTLLSTTSLAAHTAATKHRVSGPKPARWTNITPPQVKLASYDPTTHGVWGMTMDPQHPETVYVGTARQGIFKTTDAGKTWVKIDTGAGSTDIDSGAVWTLTIDPTNPQILYAAPGYGRAGVWKSTDGGVSWSDITGNSPTIKGDIGQNPWINDVAMDPANHNHLIAASKYLWGGKYGNNSGVLESLDGGATWIVHGPTGSFGWQDFVYFLNNSSTWILTTTSGTYYRTTDAGKSWKPVKIIGASPGYADIVGKIYRAANGSFYLGGRAALYRSTDNGQTWKQVVDKYITTVVGDGKTMFTSPAFSTEQGYGKTPYLVSSERDGVKWRPYSKQATCSKTECSGPASMAYDPVHHVLYSANFNAGVWKLNLSSHR